LICGVVSATWRAAHTSCGSYAEESETGSAKLYGEPDDGAPLLESLQAMAAFAGKGLDTGAALGPAGQRAAAGATVRVSLMPMQADLCGMERRVVVAAVVQ